MLKSRFTSILVFSVLAVLAAAVVYQAVLFRLYSDDRLEAVLSGRAVTKQPESVYERIIKSGKLRCGYGVYPPIFSIDPNTGERSGIYFDVAELMGERMGVEVEWAEDVGWGAMAIDGLENDRFDLFCTALYATSSRGLRLDFSMPVVYSGIGVYVRPDDFRFDDDFSEINQSNIRVATMDGEMSQMIYTSQFALAQEVAIPQLSDFSQALLNVVTNKADVIFSDNFAASVFLQNNPGALRNIASQQPLRVFPNNFAFKKGEHDLKNTLDILLNELHNNGEVEMISQKYDVSPDVYYRVAHPYRAGL